MNPYNVNIDELKESLDVNDDKGILKLELVARILKITKKMETSDILKKTGLHKSDLSRLRAMSLERFSLDKIVNLLGSLGYTMKVIVKPKQEKEAS